MTNIIAFLHTTAAYQAAVLQLMLGEANFAAKQLQLNDHIPPTTNGLVQWFVSAPPMGVAGNIATTNYSYSFEQGRLTRIAKRDWLKKTGATNLYELSRELSRLDERSVVDFATQALARLQVNLSVLSNHKMHVLRVPAQKVDSAGRNLRDASARAPTPVFQLSWGQRAPPADFSNPVRMKILGTTPEVLEFSLHDRSLGQRLLTVTNASQLLGSLPPIRHFVENLYGGRSAYETVASAERVEAWILPEAGQTPLRVSRRIANQISAVLLDFDTYQWGVQKLCSPDYGMKLRFVRGTNTVDVRFCFECDILEITSFGQTRTENFDFNHNRLATLAKKLFPKDKKIQELKKEDEKEARRRFEEEMKPRVSQQR